MKGYKTSKDYKRLKELLDKGYQVVCFITYDMNRHIREPHEPFMVTDVCIARLLEKNSKYAHYDFSCRGIGYLHYWLHDFGYDYTFEELLEARNIEFIEPEKVD